MSQFKDTQWDNTEFSKNYLDESSLYLPYRTEIIDLLLSYIGYFLPNHKDAQIIELGCGDGFIAEKILSSNKISKALMVDGSSQMLTAAKKRLKKFNNVEYKNLSFQELINQKECLPRSELVFSSLAIHHLSFEEKEKLYNLVFDLLSAGGSFINYDVVLSCSEEVEQWYLNIWKDWMEHRGQESQKFMDIPQRYKDNKDNIPSSLEEQLSMLERVGFKNVECHFKFGVFAVFGGKK